MQLAFVFLTHCIMQAPPPWTAERCIALQRVMHDLVNVQEVLEKEQSILNKVMQPMCALLVGNLTVALKQSRNPYSMAGTRLELNATAYQVS